jgi:hypothetical protein
MNAYEWAVIIIVIASTPVVIWLGVHERRRRKHDR